MKRWTLLALLLAVPLHANNTTLANADGESGEAGIDPLIVSAGLRIRF